MANPSSDWKLMNDKYYAKKELYTMEWGHLDLAKYTCAAAPYGGPIALTRNDSVVMKLSQSSARPRIEIYSSAGKLLSGFPWEGGRIVKLGWSDDEQLVVVQE